MSGRRVDVEEARVLVPLAEADPRTIGPYELRGRLGAGGMGTVYLGRHPAGDLVAIKVVRADLSEDGRFRERFRREVAAAERVRGRFVARVRDADVAAGAPWMVTDYVEGVSLAREVGTRGSLSAPMVVGLAAGLADALAEVHAAGLVHRDLKPSNVLLAPDGPKLIDFGIARALDATQQTSTGEVLGTVAWMSPEQLRGDRAGPEADVFAWAMCVVFAARGRHAFPASSGAASAMRVLADPPDLTDVPDRLVPLLARALEKDPARRPDPLKIISALAGHEVATLADAEAAAGALLEDGWDPSPAPAPGSLHGGEGGPPASSASSASLADEVTGSYLAADGSHASDPSHPSHPTALSGAAWVSKPPFAPGQLDVPGAARAIPAPRPGDAPPPRSGGPGVGAPAGGTGGRAARAGRRGLVIASAAALLTVVLSAVALAALVVPGHRAASPPAPSETSAMAVVAAPPFGGGVAPGGRVQGQDRGGLALPDTMPAARLAPTVVATARPAGQVPAPAPAPARPTMKTTMTKHTAAPTPTAAQTTPPGGDAGAPPSPSATPDPPPTVTLHRYYNGTDHASLVGGPPSSSYHAENDIGVIYATGDVPGTHPLYACWLGSDEFTSTSANCEGQEVIGQLGWVYDSAPGNPRTVPVMRCKIGGEHFDSPRRDCEGQTVEGLLGYALVK
jgi:serine/threonine protein kinase